MKTVKLPFVWRSDCEAEKSKAVASVRKEASREVSEIKAEWDQKWEPLLSKLVELSAERRPEDGTFQIHFTVDRRMMQEVAMYNDARFWGYLAEMVGHHIERELKTMNFSGLHRLADESERRYNSRRPYLTAVNSGQFDGGE